MERRPLSILYLIENSGHGGAEAQIAMQAAWVCALGHRAIVGVPGSGWLTEELRRRGVSTHRLSERRGRLTPLRWTRELMRLVRSQRVDVIQAYLLQMNFCGALAGRFTGASVVASVRGQVYDFDKPWRLWAYRLMGRAGVTFTVPSFALREALLRRAGIPPQRALAIHNGIDLDALRSRAHPPADLPAGFRVGTVGRLDPVKGLDHLIAAAAIVAPRAPEAHFVIAGDGPERAPLEEQARRLGLGDRVTFLGQRDDVPAVLASLDIFVQPSLSEGLSNALLEAMALGRPIVATDIGPNAEAVRHLESALLVPPADPQALAEAILRLLGDPGLAAALARSAQQTAERDFSLARSVERYLALYYALLEGKRDLPAEQAALEKP